MTLEWDDMFLKNKESYTTAQAADLLNVSRAVILNAIRNKELKASKIGKRGRTSSWRIKKSDFIEYCNR